MLKRSKATNSFFSELMHSKTPIRHGTEVDMWSLGVVTHTILMPPSVDTFNEIYQGDFSKLRRLGGKRRRPLSTFCIDFVERLANRRPRDRMTIEEALGHIWIQRHLKELEDIRRSTIRSWISKETRRGVSISDVAGPFRKCINNHEGKTNYSNDLDLVRE